MERRINAGNAFRRGCDTDQWSPNLIIAPAMIIRNSPHRGLKADEPTAMNPMMTFYKTMKPSISCLDRHSTTRARTIKYYTIHPREEQQTKCWRGGD